jgi:hypothetical protein
MNLTPRSPVTQRVKREAGLSKEHNGKILTEFLTADYADDSDGKFLNAFVLIFPYPCNLRNPRSLFFRFYLCVPL